MAIKTTNDKGLTYFYRTIGAAALVWTVTVICSASWNIYNERQQTLALVKKEALANFNKDYAFRLWGTKHGGVYVPPTGQTPPNPYLSHIPDRDITLPSGKRLTLMNPAYMLRQLMADFDELYGINGRITSLKPLNPSNAPDAWEREALTAFEKGAKEFFTITEHHRQRSLRLMRPMVVQAGCLKCHAHQGYKEGDIRGGVGVNVPMAPYMTMEKKAINALLLSHLVIWSIGSTMLVLVFFRGKRFILGQVKSQKAIMQSEEFVDSIVENIPDMVFVKDAANLRFVRFNKAGEKLLGYSREELIGKNNYDFFPKHEADFFTIKDREVFSNNQLIEIREETVRTRHGDEKVLHTKKLPILDREGNPLYLLGISEDITERKQAEKEIRKLNEGLEQRVRERTVELEAKGLELRDSQRALVNIVEDLNMKTEELKKANIKLQEMDRVKSMFIASMSHELRTPLNSIIGFSSILLNEWVGPVNAEQKGNLSTILRSGRHLLNLINDVIDVSKIEAGRIDSVPEDFDLHDVIEEAVHFFAKEIDEKKLSLTVESIHQEMHTDRRRLLQCMLNLLSNAVKYTEKGSVSVQARLGVRDRNLVEISVEDTGIGIREEDFPKLFNAFVRFDSPMRASIPGTGLGLYLTKKLVTEVLKGDILLSSRHREGSTFSIVIPARIDEKGFGNRG